MKTFYTLAIACLAVGTTTAYSTSNNNSNNAPSRRAFFQKAAVTAAAASAAVLLVPTPAAQAASLDACPAKSSNCIRTTWTPPAGTSKAKMAEQVKTVLQAYPQEGQSKVDLGGWEIVEDGLANAGSARVEYKSGIGNFAKFLNGNKPFVDDLKIEITDTTVELRSSSRIGESDLGVNQKRLAYMANAIKAMGWEAAEPKY
jgi:hypothetical protein